jgi:hypothetical protein
MEGREGLGLERDGERVVDCRGLGGEGRARTQRTHRKICFFPSRGGGSFEAIEVAMMVASYFQDHDLDSNRCSKMP